MAKCKYWNQWLLHPREQTRPDACGGCLATPRLHHPSPCAHAVWSCLCSAPPAPPARGGTAGGGHWASSPLSPPTPTPTLALPLDWILCCGPQGEGSWAGGGHLLVNSPCSASGAWGCPTPGSGRENEPQPQECPGPSQGSDWSLAVRPVGGLQTRRPGRELCWLHQRLNWLFLGSRNPILGHG